jgi:flagellar motor switch protein FliN/FliY
VTQATAPASHAFTPHSPAGRAADPTLAENVELFASAFCEGAGPALTTVLNQRVTVDVTGVDTGTVVEMAAALPLPWVVVGMTYQRGLTGGHSLILPHATALAIARALEVEEGDDELRSGDLEAIREAVNQVLGAASPALLPLLGRSVAWTLASVRVVESQDALPGDIVPAGDASWLARCRLRAGDVELALGLTIGDDVARALAATVVPAEPTPAPRAAEGGGGTRLDLILDVTLPVTVELGRARMQIQEILKLAPGSVIELDKSAGDPVELYINDRPIAKGEVVIIDENFGVRLTSIVTTTERIKTLR